MELRDRKYEAEKLTHWRASKCILLARYENKQLWMVMCEEHVTRMAENKHAYKTFVGKSIGRPCYIWDSSIKMGYI